MPEITVNLHVHTVYSDGHATHAEIAQAAIQAGLDVVIITDHNIHVEGLEGYTGSHGKQALVLVGEEVHNQALNPQKNHLLVIGAEKEVATYAQKPQILLDQIRRAGGLSFIAHPNDPALPAFKEPDISWEDWSIRNFTGIELWNGFSELKHVSKNWLQTVYYVFNPKRIAHGPSPETLALWDRLTVRQGRKIVAVGGSDAHALPYRLGPFRKTIFPYAFHFQTINTHLLIPADLRGIVEQDKPVVLAALADGHAFIGNDQLASTRGFRFSAKGKEDVAMMGDSITGRGGITLQVHLPTPGERNLPTECRLLKDGQTLKSWRNRVDTIHFTHEPGVYRVEVTLNTRWGRRGWIYSNPIYIRG
jgi:hypothetical protein